jgi:hypothetical protein
MALLPESVQATRKHKKNAPKKTQVAEALSKQTQIVETLRKQTHTVHEFVEL